ncbi:hypothetical protein NDU88_004598 [Pleurodeles waltl]|uniref:Uncharacterized protein n=1 Tax=Pleurodeles waltl TaxID=8319 RepID=A0AAV7NSX9_PLEWA|nr:hypothetical protein NDU88_004598 [Pleurodeles waltl]
MYVPDLDGPGVEAAVTPFDINDRVTVLQDLQQFREDNSSASAASSGIKDEPVPFLQEEEAGDGRVAAVDPVDSEDEDTEDEDEDNRSAIIHQYFQ